MYSACQDVMEPQQASKHVKVPVLPGKDRFRGVFFGDIAQLGERCVRIAEVGGSNPPISTIDSS